MKKVVLLALVIVFFAGFSLAASIGVTPGYVDYGEVEPGDSIEVELYITTSEIDEEFEVEPEYKSSLKYALGENAVIDMRNVSEQNIESWIEFDQDTFNIDPSTSDTYQLPEGTSVSAEGVIRFTVSIPPNTEPGYRIGTIQINPSLSGERSGAGAKLIAQTVPGFAFRVPGSVNRDIELAGIQGVRIGENRVQIINQLRNTGTVTTTLTGGEADILDSEGRRVGQISVNSAKLSPGEYAEVDDLWVREDLEGGEYSVEGQGDYRTGETYISGDFVITDTIRERQSIQEPSTATEPEKDTPLTLIIILSLLLGTLLYLFDVRFSWTFIMTVVTAVGLYISLSSVPTYLLLIPVFTIAVMLYV